MKTDNLVRELVKYMDENFTIKEINEILNEIFDDRFALNLKKIDYRTQQNWKWIHFYPVTTFKGEKIQVDFQTRDFTAVQPGDIAIQYTDPGEGSLNITSWRLFKEDLVEWLWFEEDIVLLTKLLLEKGKNL